MKVSMIIDIKSIMQFFSVKSWYLEIFYYTQSRIVFTEIKEVGFVVIANIPQKCFLNNKMHSHAWWHKVENNSERNLES